MGYNIYVVLHIQADQNCIPVNVKVIKFCSEKIDSWMIFKCRPPANSEKNVQNNKTTN